MEASLARGNRASEQGVIRWGGVETEWEKRAHSTPCPAGWEGTSALGASNWIAVSPKASARRYAQSGGAGDHQRSRRSAVAIMDNVLLAPSAPGPTRRGRRPASPGGYDRVVGGGSRDRRSSWRCSWPPANAGNHIYDVVARRQKNFARHMEKRTGRKVAVCATVDETVKGADIVVTATGSTEPLLLRSHLEPGMLYIHVGGNECEYEVISAADKRYVDDWEQIKHRDVSSLAHMFFAGKLKDEDITAEIGAVVVGDRPGRESDDEIIYVNTVGTRRARCGPRFPFSLPTRGKGPRDHRQDIRTNFGLCVQGCPSFHFQQDTKPMRIEKMPLAKCRCRTGRITAAFRRSVPSQFRCDGQNLQRLSPWFARWREIKKGLRAGEPGHRRSAPNKAGAIVAPATTPP